MLFLKFLEFQKGEISFWHGEISSTLTYYTDNIIIRALTQLEDIPI